MDRERTAYEALLKTYRGGYSNIVLDEALRSVPDERDRAYITRLFYGVLERDAALCYAIERLCPRPPKPPVALLLKMGMYMLSDMDVPAYAAIDKTVELARRIGKSGVCAFVNAVLRRYTSFRYPARGEVPDGVYLSVVSGVPEWLAKKLADEYGFDFAFAMLSARPYAGTHIRRNSRAIGQAAFEELLKKCDDFHPDSLNIGYYVTHNTMKSLPDTAFTPQSLSSMLAAEYYLAALGCPSGRVLDVCAAPGGKAVYMSEKGAYDITACDKYPHRLSLTEKYAARMGASVCVEQNDATKLREAWRGRFDLVVCDVPCSGIGVLASRPDIARNRSAGGMAELPALQYAVLKTSAAYVAPGGALCYSTCTVLKEENEAVVERFLRDGEFALYTPEFPYGFVRDGVLKTYPQDGMDGFFAAAFRRKA